MKPLLHYRHNELFIENISLTKIANQFGTPCYIYSRNIIEQNWRSYHEALSLLNHRICYAVKANSNIGILNILNKLGSSFDIVSLGELKRVLAAGGKPDQIIFSGVGKSESELIEAVKLGIYCIDVESESEMKRLHQIGQALKKKIAIALRINPNIDAETHAYISTGLKENKFGIELKKIKQLCQEIKAYSYLELKGLACHLGSQITDIQPFSLALDCLINCYHELKSLGLSIKHINVGGGLGIYYQQENPPSILDYGTLLQKKLENLPVEVIIEPGRSIIGNAGVLLTKIEYIKETQEKKFAIVDAAMNDLIRPALYQAWQPILPVTLHEIEEKIYDIVGPICESSDFLGKNRSLAIVTNDLLAIDIVGAYGFSMSSNYNSRPKCCEVLIDHDGITPHLIRRREKIDELFASENLIRCK